MRTARRGSGAEPKRSHKEELMDEGAALLHEGQVAVADLEHPVSAGIEAHVVLLGEVEDAGRPDVAPRFLKLAAHLLLVH